MEPFSKNYETDWIETREVGGGFFSTEERHTVYTTYVIPVKFSFLKELPNGYLVFEMSKPNANLGNSFDERFSNASYAIIHPDVIDHHSLEYMKDRCISHGVDMFEWIYQQYMYEQAGETGFEHPLWGYYQAPDTLTNHIFLKLKETIPSNRCYGHTDVCIDKVSKIKKSCMVKDDFLATLERILDYEINKVAKATIKQLNKGLSMDDLFKRDILPICEKAMHKLETFGLPKMSIHKLNGDHTYVEYVIREESYNVNRVFISYYPDKKRKVVVYNNDEDVFNDKYHVHVSDFGYQSGAVAENEIFGAILAAYFAERFASLQELMK